MRTTAAWIVGVFVLCGCDPDRNHAASATAKPAIDHATSNGGQQATSATADLPSYEVTIAGAQADRVHALDACDDKQGAAHVACVRDADRVYDEARGAAEKIRGSGR